MAPHSPLRTPHPDKLPLPLRDLMRGMQKAARIPMAMAQPIVTHLPGPLRDGLSHIGQRIEEVYNHSLTIWRPNASEIRQAATQLTVVRPADLAVTGRVVAWALEVGLAQASGPAFFISETTITLALKDTLNGLAADTRPVDRAAHAMLAIIGHGLGPSTQELPLIRMTPERAAQLRTTTFSAMLFLLAERPVNADEEARILSYAITIAELITSDIDAAAPDAEAIAGLLHSYAEMI